MATLAKTVVATGCSSGLGFEAVKQLLQQPQPYRFILACRDTKTAQAAYDGLSYDGAKHKIDYLPIELSDLRTVKTFAHEALAKVGASKLDFLFLNAAVVKPATTPGPRGSRWSEQFVVNHLSQHYLVHLLRAKLVSSRSRIVVVSSGAACNVPDVAKAEAQVLADSGTPGFPVLYEATKFMQLLGTHWWRRELPECHVVAVSPGAIPGTGLGRHNPEQKELPEHIQKTFKTIPQGAASLLAGFTRDDFPEDPEQIFLTSWGEWWPKETFKTTLDKALQDKWSFSKEQIEREEHVD